MHRHMTLATRFLTGMAVSMALAGCLFDASPRERARDGCFLGGCGNEVCSDRPDVVSPCIWRDALVCFRDATCERQADDTCGWSQTSELKACLASHDPLPGSQP
jgi:hypothetical protein